MIPKKLAKLPPAFKYKTEAERKAYRDGYLRGYNTAISRLKVMEKKGDLVIVPAKIRKRGK